MDQFERAMFSVVSILLLILLLRRTRRMRSPITYLGFEYEVSEDVLVTGSLITYRRRNLRERAALRRQAWVYPRPSNGLKKGTETETLKYCGKSIPGWPEIHLTIFASCTRIETITDRYSRKKLWQTVNKTNELFHYFTSKQTKFR